MGMIFDIKRFAIHDGPGIRTTVFLKGCPLDCWWCHNPEGRSQEREFFFRAGRCVSCGTCVEVCTEKAVSMDGNNPVRDAKRCTLCGECVDACGTEARDLVGRSATAAEVMAEIVKDNVFYEESGGGATFSGGEPLAQPEFLEELLLACKDARVHTAVDTSGFAEPEVVERIASLADMFLYDLKVMDDDAHLRLTGFSNRQILANLENLSRRGCEIVIRVPLIPGLNDGEDALRTLGVYVAELPHTHPIDVLPYERVGVEKYARMNLAYRLPDVMTPDAAAAAKAASILENYGLDVTVGGEAP